ncbi:MAG: bL21 family ribosomal protein [Akkermansia sp.]
MAYAIFKTGGKQYRVQTGDVIDVECINTLEEGRSKLRSGAYGGK